MYALEAQEERRYPRVPTGEAIRIQFEGDSALVAGSLVNVGVGGAFVRCAHPVEVGRELKCAFFVATQGEQQLVCCRARVAWVAPTDGRRRSGPGFGVSFTRYQHDSFELLSSFTRYAC
jgi:Tfp pilus assembly protein PilZ